MIDNEEKVTAELQIVAKSQDVIAQYLELGKLVQNTTLPGQEGVIALSNLENVFVSNRKMTIDSLINMLCLATASSEHSWSDSRFSSAPPEWHKSLGVIIATFLKDSKLDSDDQGDKQMMIHWLNKLSYCLFRLSESSIHHYNVSLALVRLFSLSEFFADDEFATESYFRFIKKYLDTCQNSVHLQKILVLLDIFTKEDERTILFSFPKLLPDSIDALAVCAKGLLVSPEVRTAPKATLECLQEIHTVQASLFEQLLEHFAKYDMRGLACLTSIKLISHLTEVTNLFTADCNTDEETRFRLPIIKIIVSLCKIAYRFETEQLTLAPQHQVQIAKMIEGCEFRPSFLLLNKWVVQILHEVLKIGKILQPGSPSIQVEYLHQCMECLATCMDINTLSLEIQKSAEQ